MTAVLVLPAPGARLWRADGRTATVTEATGRGVLAVRHGGRVAELVDLGEWRLAAACDYCTQPAEVQIIGGQPDDVLCKTCSRDHFDRPADWVRPLPRTVIRALFGGCQRLG